MGESKLISIIIPVFRGEKYLPATLRSIQAQTLSDWECVIVDDGSPDGTVAVAKQFAAADPRIRVFTQENRGPATARNHGYSLINPGSKYVTFMDGDDLWLPDTLEILAGELERKPAMIGAHGLAEYIDQAGDPMKPGLFSDWGKNRRGFDENGRIRQLDESEPTTFAALLLNNTVYPPGIVLTRKWCYEKVGPFDLAVVPVEDWDMVLRLSRYGGFRFVNKVVLHYRRHTGNLSSQNDSTMQKSIRAMRYKTFFSAENSEEQKRILRKSWKTMQIINVKGKLETISKKFAAGNIAAATRMLLGLNVQIYRYLRGYPTLKGL